MIISYLRRRISAIHKYRHYSTRPPRCDAHMNEMPVPCGPWEPFYNERQVFYNKVLVFGASWWLMSLALLIYTNSLFLNWGPPALPGPPSDYVEECDDSEK